MTKLLAGIAPAPARLTFAGSSPISAAVAVAEERFALETPCIKICAIDSANRLCTGCGRTLAEIAQWSGLAAAERRRIMAELPARLRRAGAAGQPGPTEAR